MRVGRVVQVRLNPKDCMGVVDVVRKAGLVTQGMSFAQATKLALAVLLESARRHGTIPDRDGFEFNELMQGFETSHARKVAITSAIDSLGSEISVPALPAGSSQVSRLERRVSELLGKKMADPDNWTSEEEQELDRVQAELQQVYKDN